MARVQRVPVWVSRMGHQKFSFFFGYILSSLLLWFPSFKLACSCPSRREISAFVTDNTRVQRTFHTATCVLIACL